MARRLNSIADVQAYVAGLLDRTEHHATVLSGVAMALLGYVLAVADADSIQVMERDGEAKNVCWFKIDGRRYVLSYNRQNQQIELREDSIQGDVMTSVDGSSTLSDVANAVRYRIWAAGK